ncbi:MAG TPA: HEAT repeat domain-containing protein [Terriglobales bacterium]|nr:HEAT repeat domain-containing protein [Terriglobales bacterium]
MVTAASSAIATVTGTVGEVRKIDVHGRSARLAIESVVAIAPEVHDPIRRTLRPGSSLTVAWEELASTRASRLESGARVLVVLALLPPGSIWRERFPDSEQRSGIAAIAANGAAVMHHPDASSSAALQAYLAIPAGERQTPLGIEALVDIARRAGGDLPQSAVATLATIDGLDTQLSPQARERLVDLVADRRRDVSLRRAILALCGERQLTVVAPALRRLLAAGTDLEAESWDALARIGGGLTASEVGDLLSRPQPELRLVGARWARHSDHRERLLGLALSDPAPPVRAAAVESAIALAGPAIVDQVAPLLADLDPQVRLAAARALGKHRAAVVPQLRAIVAGEALELAKGAVLALDAAGPAGRAALAEIAERHHDESIRNLAALALGKLEGHRH